MKIAVIGYSGSGKSTLARKLGQKHGVDVLHLDAVHWLPGWQTRSREEKTSIVGDFLDTHEGWVIDGTYSKLHFDRRMTEADEIIFMNFNQKIDWDFVKWVLYKGRTRKTRDMYKKVINQHGHKVTVIKNQRGLDTFGKQRGI